MGLEKPHLLILDEPTNHLDIDSRRALLDALNGYEGAVVLITHDRSLMELVADRLWLTADGTIQPFDGDMDDYAKLVLARARAAARTTGAAAAPPPEPPPPIARPGKIPTGSARRRAEAAEGALARAATALEAIDAALTDPKALQDPQRIADLGRRREQAEAALVAAEQAWMEAAEAYQAVQGAG